MSEKTEVIVNPNGPLLVKGNFALKDAKGQEFGLGGRDLIGLCRCGASENKPFCDGSHGQAGFDSTVEAINLPSKG